MWDDVIYPYSGISFDEVALTKLKIRVTVHFLENDDISLVRKRCVLGLGLELRLRFGLVLGLAEIRFRSNVFSSMCEREK